MAKDTIDGRLSDRETRTEDIGEYRPEYAGADRAPYQLDSREYRRRAKQQYGWVGGAVLIAVGGLLLLQNMGVGMGLQNWWALFLFIPAAVSGLAAYNTYRDKGYLDRAAWSALSGALIPLAIGLFFLFGLNWGVFWPLILIVVGITALINGMYGRGD